MRKSNTVNPSNGTSTECQAMLGSVWFAVSAFSFREFLTDFTDMLKRQYGSRRVQATVVYNEYIHDKHHIHMNSTRVRGEGGAGWGSV